MSLPLLLLLIGLFSGFKPLNAQLWNKQEDLSGHWVGVLTQNEGGYAASYEFSLLLEQHGRMVTGRARVGAKEVQAEFLVSGVLQTNGTWLFEEGAIQFSQHPPYLEWCEKGYNLRVDFDQNGRMHLTGPWWGLAPSGPCIPGSIRLWLQKNRA